MQDWPDEAKRLHGEWWEPRIARQKEIDASIAARRTLNTCTTNRTKTRACSGGRSVHRGEHFAPSFVDCR